jgi:transposase-like protein
MRSAPPSPAAVSALEEVQQQFQLWRKTKTGRGRIPASLWQAATEVFYIGGYSLHKISKTLHLNYTAFKQHVEPHLPSSNVDLEW